MMRVKLFIMKGIFPIIFCISPVLLFMEEITFANALFHLVLLDARKSKHKSYFCFLFSVYKFIIMIYTVLQLDFKIIMYGRDVTIIVHMDFCHSNF